MAEYTPAGGYAGFWSRFAAILIDSFILAIPTFILGIVIGSSFAGEFDDPVTAAMGAEMMANAVGIGICWLYFSLLESSPLQATLGKRALGIVVVDATGSRLTWGRATGRHFGKFLSAIPLGLGYFMAGFTERKQALHDLMAGTLVVVGSRDRQSATPRRAKARPPPSPFAGFQDIPETKPQKHEDTRLLTDGRNHGDA